MTRLGTLYIFTSGTLPFYCLGLVEEIQNEWHGKRRSCVCNSTSSDEEDVEEE